MSVQVAQQTHQPDAIDAALRGARQRIRIMTTLRAGGRALCYTAVPCAISVGLSKLNWYETPSPVLLASIMAGTSLVASIYAATKKLTQLDVARLTERRTDLKERLSSALEFRAEGDADHPFYSEQLTDAQRHAGAINLKTTFPIRVPWQAPVGAVCALAVFLTFYLPTLPRFWSQQKKQEMAEVKKKGIEIEKLAKDSTKNAEQQKLDETKKAAAEAKKLGEEMKKGKMSKKESLVALSKLTKKMEETQQKLAQPPAKKSLAEAHKEFQKALDKMTKDKEDEAKKAAEDLKKMPKGQQVAKDTKKPDGKMEPKQKESEAGKQMKQAMQQMADALANQDNQQMKQAMQKMAEQMQKGEMSKEEMKQMQQALQQLAQSLKDTNQQDAAQQMQQMAEMMQGNQMDSKTMQQIAGMMNKAGEKMGKGQNMAMMMDGKALGELAQALKEGRMTQALGKGNGQGNGGKGPGKGYGGSGGPSTAMKDPGATSPILVAKGMPNQPAGKGKQGSAAEFAKYLASTSAAPKHLPNGKVSGVRSENGNELQMSMSGDPQAAKSSSPYYQVVQTSKKQAESTLSKENIPASLKKQVKDYFDSIKP